MIKYSKWFDMALIPSATKVKEKPSRRDNYSESPYFPARVILLALQCLIILTNPLRWAHLLLRFYRIALSEKWFPHIQDHRGLHKPAKIRAREGYPGVDVAKPVHKIDQHIESLSSLPTEIQIQIFQCMDVPSLLRISQTSRHFAALAAHDPLQWEPRFKRDWKFVYGKIPQPGQFRQTYRFLWLVQARPHWGINERDRKLGVVGVLREESAATLIGHAQLFMAPLKLAGWLSSPIYELCREYHRYSPSNIFPFPMCTVRFDIVGLLQQAQQSLQTSEYHVFFFQAWIVAFLLAAQEASTFINCINWLVLTTMSFGATLGEQRREIAPKSTTKLRLLYAWQLFWIPIFLYFQCYLFASNISWLAEQENRILEGLTKTQLFEWTCLFLSSSIQYSKLLPTSSTVSVIGQGLTKGVSLLNLIWTGVMMCNVMESVMTLSSRIRRRHDYFWIADNVFCGIGSIIQFILGGLAYGGFVICAIGHGALKSRRVIT